MHRHAFSYRHWYIGTESNPELFLYSWLGNVLRRRDLLFNTRHAHAHCLYWLAIRKRAERGGWLRHSSVLSLSYRITLLWVCSTFSTLALSRRGDPRRDWTSDRYAGPNFLFCSTRHTAHGTTKRTVHTRRSVTPKSPEGEQGNTTSTRRQNSAHRSKRGDR